MMFKEWEKWLAFQKNLDFSESG